VCPRQPLGHCLKVLRTGRCANRGSLLGWGESMAWLAPHNVFLCHPFNPWGAMCALSPNSVISQLDLKWGCCEARSHGLAGRPRGGPNSGISTPGAAILCALMLKLIPSIQMPHTSNSWQPCGQILLCLPGSAWIFLDLKPQIWEADFVQLLQRAFLQEMPQLSRVFEC
jgi:hypothetical protein